MSELQRFVPAEQEILVGVLYRVGHWMIHIDDTDEGDASEKMEEAQMIALLTKISKSPKAGALICEMAAESLRQQSSWARWADDGQDTIGHVARARDILKGGATLDEFNMFTKSVMMVATGVARAAREEPDVPQEDTGYFSWLSDKASGVVLALTDPEAHKDMNVSPAEDTALHDLLSTLKA